MRKNLKYPRKSWRMPQSVDRLENERKKQELSVSTVVFINCREGGEKDREG